MRFIRKYILYLLLVLLILSAVFFYFSKIHKKVVKNTIPVGVLFSKTGIMADSEKPVINAVLMAIDEINHAGGINNKIIVPIVYDAESNWKRYALLAEKMIVEDNVKVIFGCWTSAARKEVRPIVEKYNNLLVYPTQYEGAEDSQNIIYLGATPNQQLVPAVSWLLLQGFKKFYLVGSDYIYPHVANEILNFDIQSMGGTILGISYIPLGSADVDKTINEIIKLKPDVVLNTINGITNIAFFTRLYELTKGQSRPPVMSFSLATADMEKIGIEKIIGDYSSWSYYLGIDMPKNFQFLKSYKNKYGSIDTINDPAITAYTGVFLWAKGVKEAYTFEPNLVRDHMLRQSDESPSGVIYIDSDNNHAWRIVRIARVTKNHLSEIIWSSLNPIPPIVYPEFKSKAAWDLFEYQLFLKWENSWENKSGEI